MNKLGTKVAVGFVILMVISMSVTAGWWIPAVLGAVGWVATHPGSTMCAVGYDKTNDGVLEGNDGPTKNSGYGRSASYCSVAGGSSAYGHYDGTMAARATLYVSSTDRNWGGFACGVTAYTSSGIYSIFGDMNKHNCGGGLTQVASY